MSQTVFIDQKPIQLDAAALLQSGGEGMVFAHGRQAIKLYHTPTPQQGSKLTAFLRTGFRLPAAMIVPTKIVRDARGSAIGFLMPQLPPRALPLRKLAALPFRRQQQIPLRRIPPLLQQLHDQLTTLHRQGIIIGDLNDSNIFFTHKPGAPLQAYWIDLDSSQFAGHPCPVAMEAFLDPQLYAIHDFGHQPHFSEQTDWYAFSVLAFKLLLGVHPFGGTHPQHKTIAGRAQAGISILHTEVRLPPHSLPPAVLSDGLLAHLKRIFERGERRPFPRRLLDAYLADLTDCPSCGLSFPRQRAHCPHCRRRSTPAPKNATTNRPIFANRGAVLFVQANRDGRFLSITYKNGAYALLRAGIGGLIEETPLFQGQPGYRFAAFDRYLVVNRPGSGKLLLLDCGDRQPGRLQMLTTATFREKAVFAATPHALYRIAGRWIMRGIVRDGLYLEDPIATAHHLQTNFWAAPDGDRIAGFHRVFATHRFFGLDGRGNETTFNLPTIPSGTHILTAKLHPGTKQTVISLELKDNGRMFTENHYFAAHGRWQECRTDDKQQATPFFWHPQGQLELQGSELFFKPRESKQWVGPN